MDYLFLQIYLLCKLTLRSSCMCDIALYSGLHTMDMSDICKILMTNTCMILLLFIKLSALNWGKPKY